MRTRFQCNEAQLHRSCRKMPDDRDSIHSGRLYAAARAISFLDDYHYNLFCEIKLDIDEPSSRPSKYPEQPEKLMVDVKPHKKLGVAVKPEMPVAAIKTPPVNRTFYLIPGKSQTLVSVTIWEMPGCHPAVHALTNDRGAFVYGIRQPDGKIVSVTRGDTIVEIWTTYGKEPTETCVLVHGVPEDWVPVKEPWRPVNQTALKSGENYWAWDRQHGKYLVYWTEDGFWTTTDYQDEDAERIGSGVILLLVPVPMPANPI